MGHARYLIDNYTYDVANNSSVTQVQIIEPTTGQPVAGTALMPYLAFDSVLYYNQSGGMMTGPYGNNIWSPHEAGALQRIAGRRHFSILLRRPCGGPPNRSTGPLSDTDACGSVRRTPAPVPGGILTCSD